MLPTVLLLLAVAAAAAQEKPPNIVFIVADDLGWSDVGFRNPRVHTPTIDSLARDGVVLDQSYVHPLCSPTRAAILSGLYAQNVGLQNNVVLTTVPHYLRPEYTLLPESLHDLGYSTHMVGKWHLGFCKWEVTPLYRGFDTFFGSYNWGGDQYNHTHQIWTVARFDGVDLSDQGVGTEEYEGIHSTDMYTDRAIEVIRGHDQEKPFFMYLSYKAVHDPIQVPEEYLPRYSDVEDDDRRHFLAMTTHLDDGLGRVMDALRDSGMDENTLVVLISDNGGDPRPRHGGYNYPLRGIKGTVWEGGTRSTTIVYGDVLQRSAYVNSGLFHATDWYPTLIKIAGGNVEELAGIDGIDNSEMLLSGAESQRNEMVYHINELRTPFQGVIREGPYKFLLGVTRWWTDADDGWLVPPELPQLQQGREQRRREERRQAEGGKNCFLFPRLWNRQLYNVIDDPEERVDLYADLPDIACRLEERLAFHVDRMEPAFYPTLNYSGAAADPDNFGGFWTPGWCEDDEEEDAAFEAVL